MSGVLKTETATEDVKGLTTGYGVSVLRTSRALEPTRKEDQTIKPRERG